MHTYNPSLFQLRIEEIMSTICLLSSNCLLEGMESEEKQGEETSSYIMHGGIPEYSQIQEHGHYHGEQRDSSGLMDILGDHSEQYGNLWLEDLYSFRNMLSFILHYVDKITVNYQQVTAIVASLNQLYKTLDLSIPYAGFNNTYICTQLYIYIYI